MRLCAAEPRLIFLICFATLLLHVVLFWERSILSLRTGSQESGEALGAITLPQAVVNAEREVETGLENAQLQVDVGKKSIATGTTLEEKLSSLAENQENGMDLDLGTGRKKIRLFVGVFTGFNDPIRMEEDREIGRYDYWKRRRALRDTWFPGSKEEKRRLEEKGIIVRFVIGHTDDEEEEERMNKEEQETGDLLRLPINESYLGLTNKTKTFFTAVSMTYDADWVVKIDDDVYLMVERILLAATQWDKMGAGYIGCMTTGLVRKKTRVLDPYHLLLGEEYNLHAFGTMYALSQSTIKSVIVQDFNNLRHLIDEDAAVGVWMLGHNITYFEDMRLCAAECSDAAIGILKKSCQGLCDPFKDLHLLHNNQSCKGRPNGTLEYLPSNPKYAAFESMHV